MYFGFTIQILHKYIQTGSLQNTKLTMRDPKRTQYNFHNSLNTLSNELDQSDIFTLLCARPGICA